jgi:hypothetical protein
MHGSLLLTGQKIRCEPRGKLTVSIFSEVYRLSLG